MSDAWDDLADSWMLILEGAGVGDKTRRDYTRTLTYFRRWLDQRHPGIAPGAVTKTMIAEWFAEMRRERPGGQKSLSAVTIANRYRHLQQWYRYLVQDAEVYEVSPMYGMRPPKVPKKSVPVYEDDELRRLVKACEGKDFTSRRDMAIILLLMDTGIRREECANLAVADVNLRTRRVRIQGKGDKERHVPVGVASALAIDKYKRERDRHPDADLDVLWLSNHGGALTADGIHQMLKRRGEMAGVPHIRAHRFRHTMASAWLAGKGTETDLMAIAGWETTQMLRRYTDYTKSDRAAEAHRSHGLADKLLRDAGRKRGRRA